MKECAPMVTRQVRNRYRKNINNSEVLGADTRLRGFSELGLTFRAKEEKLAYSDARY